MARSLLFAGVVALALMSAVPATAQPTPLKIDTDKSWKHKPTGIQFPVTLSGLTRTEIAEYTANGAELAAQYEDPAQTARVTIFLYRNVSGSVPLWFDRARFIIKESGRYGKPEAGGIIAVTPRGHANPSGLMESFATTGPFRSTALAIFPAKEFYVKIRASSTALDRNGLAMLLTQVVAEFDAPKDRDSMAAAPIADCSSALPVRGPAQLVKASDEDRMMAALLGGLVGQVAARKQDKKDKAAPLVYCREPVAARIEYGVYRQVGADNRYMLATYDNGRAIFVGRDELGALVAKGEKPLRYGVTFYGMDRVDTFPQFETLPTAEQAYELVNSGRPISSSVTWGTASGNVSISTGQ